MKRYHHVYLSPHIDDVSLSCGGAIYHQQQAGEAVLTVTVFAAQPNLKSFSAYVDWMHGIWGNLDEVVATRLAEDQASMAVLGCDAQYLPFLDCIYRGEPEADVWYYTSNEELFGRLHPDDLPLNEAIAETVIDLNPDPTETVIYAPLAIGHHVDHQLVHQAARHLLSKGYHVAFYEDYPYADPEYPYSSHSADNLYPLEAALADSADLRLTPQLQFLTEADLQAKVASIRAYSSQMAMLFENETLVEKYVRAYTLRVGKGESAERVWTVGE
ncbi:MAG: PIG-L family deacetylase [Anaerolineae bacterium]|nr:PIG-L family deacetylase [Anaerolineae bacterium]